MNKREQAQKKVLGNCFVCGGSRSTQSHGSLSGWIFRFNPCTCNSGTGNSASTVRETPEIDFDLDAIELPDRFDFVELIGQGGMGTVLKVNDRVSGEALALKLLIADHLEDPVAIRRFEQEADAAACLSHPNLVAVRDYGLLNTGAPYLAMEYLEGDSLADILERQVFLDQEEAFDIFIQICNAMGHAHFRGVIHRDLKPSNVMVSVKEGVSTVKIVDFGIARFIGSDGNTISNITRTGEVFGSPEYMSPEQCKGEYLDHRTDIYSLGCVMYECLTGRTPFAAPNAVKTILKQLNESAEGFRKRYRFLEISQEMELIVCQCLRKNPDLRYQHMEEVAKDLEFVRAGRPPRVATDQRLRRRHGKLSRSHKAGIGLIIAMSIAPYLHFFDSYDTITALFKFVVSLFLQSCFLASLFFSFRLGAHSYSLIRAFRQSTSLYAGDGWLVLICFSLILEALVLGIYSLCFAARISNSQIFFGFEAGTARIASFAVVAIFIQIILIAVWVYRRNKNTLSGPGQGSYAKPAFW